MTVSDLNFVNFAGQPASKELVDDWKFSLVDRSVEQARYRSGRIWKISTGFICDAEG